jgi:hypothetical protein
MICPICKKVLRKYPDGCYYQRCPICGKVQSTTHHGLPVLAPLSGCGNDKNIKQNNKKEVNSC